MNLLVAEKMKETKLQLETFVREQKHSESEKTLLKSEIGLVNHKLVKKNRCCGELELDQKAMKDESLESVHSYNLLLGSLQGALAERDTLQKELLELKDAFARLIDEKKGLLETLKELEQKPMVSSSEVHKVEEVSEHTPLTELQLKRTFELEKTLEVAQSKEKEMEDLTNDLKEELKKLYEKIGENQYVEELLRTNSVELSTIQDKLEISRSTVADLDQKLVSKDAIIHDLTQELDLQKASEKQMKMNIVKLETSLSSCKEELQEKLLKFEEIELKLQEQEREKERIGVSFKTQLLWQRATLQSLQQDLSDLSKEKVTLQSTVADLNFELSMNEDLRKQLEAKLNLAEQNFSKTDSLLSQALSCNKELEQKQKSLEHLHQDMQRVTEISSKRNVELEGLIRSSILSEESVKKKLKESEMRLSSAEKHNMNLKQQLNLMEMRCLEAETEIEELKIQLKQHSTLIRKIDEENSLSRRRVQGYENRIGQLESSLNKSFRRNTELEKELNNLLENEGRIATTPQSNLELEDKAPSSRFKSGNVVEGIGKLEGSLEAANYQIQELEQLLESTMAKYREAETELRHYSNKVSALVAEIEAYQARSSSLEALLHNANEKERELTDALNVAIKERKNIEDLSNIQAKNLLGAENLIQVLQYKLQSLGANMESAEEQPESSSIQEKELVEKLRYVGEQLKHQEMVVEETTSKYLEMQLLNEFLIDETKSKLQEAALELVEKLRWVGEQLKRHEIDVEEITSKHLEMELLNEFLINESESKLLEAALELVEKLRCSGDQLKRQEIDAEEITSKYLEMELLNEFLIKESKSKLQEAALELVEKLRCAGDQLKRQEIDAEEITSKYLEMELLNEFLIKESKSKLQEAALKFKEKESEVEELHYKLKKLEEQKSLYKDQAIEATENVASLEAELEAKVKKLVFLENKVEDLNCEVSESHSKYEQVVFEKEMMDGMISKLKLELEACQLKLEELNRLLDSNRVQMEENARQIACHLQAITRLTNDNSRYLEIQSKTESYLKETEVQLHESIEKVKQKGSEVGDLNEKLLSLETQLRNYKEQASESALGASSHKEQLAYTILKVTNLDAIIKQLQRNIEQSQNVIEDLTRDNLSLSQELVIYMAKMKELQNQFHTVFADKDGRSIQLHSFKKEIEVLRNQLKSDKQIHQPQIIAGLEEKNKITEMYQKERKELKAIVTHLEEQLNEQKARELHLNATVENLIADNYLMQGQILELEQKLLFAERSYRKQIEYVGTTTMEKEAILKLKEYTNTMEEQDILASERKKVQNELNLASIKEQLKLEKRKLAFFKISVAKLGDIHGKTFQNQKKIAEVGNKLKLEDATIEDEIENVTTEAELKDEIEVTSRDHGLSTHMMFRIKKEACKYQALEPASLLLPTQDEEPSLAMAFKFILGVALLSMIVGIILGKRY